MEEFASIRFFRVLLEGFPTKLSLPLDLGKNLFLNVNEERAIKNATLISSANGDVRSIQLCKDGNSVYFGGQGWHKFTLAYSLQFGYFLVFRYRGNMIFTFRVFDTSTCERSISLSGSILDQLDNLEINDDNHEDQVEAPYPTGWRGVLAEDVPKKRKGKSREVPEFLDAPEAVDPISERPPGPVRRSSMCKISSNGKPYFETTMAACNITKLNTHLHIPASFRDAVGITMDVTELIIRDLKGRSRRVNVFHRTRYRTIYEYRETTIIKGWLNTARANKLKIGDNVMFELISNENDELIKIQMLKI